MASGRGSKAAYQMSMVVEKLELGFVPQGDILMTCLAAVTRLDLKPVALFFELMTTIRTRTREEHRHESDREGHRANRII